MSEPKIRCEGLRKYFPIKQSLMDTILGRGEEEYLKAVDDVSFEIRQGESFGLAGESGCGKTTTAKSIIRLIEPTAGDIYFDGENIADHSAKQLRTLRRDAQLIFQDPYESINPRFKVQNWVGEPLTIHDIGNREERRERVYETLDQVGLQPPEAFLDEYPTNLSGGERQRLAIARALVLNPSFLVADEPASMLDVSIRARILKLFRNLQSELELTSLYISHDLALLKYMCDRIGIMYLGKLVEVGPTEQIINDPKHPYTQALVRSTPVIDPDVDRRRVTLEGSVPDPVNIPDACRFADRCPLAMPECVQEEPPMYDVGAGQQARCVLYDGEHDGSERDISAVPQT